MMLQLATEGPAVRPTMRAAREVLEAVCAEYGITAEHMLSPDRHRSIAEARHLAFWLLRNGRRFSFPEIGIVMRRDHTTVMSGIASIERKMGQDKFLRETAERLLKDHGVYRAEDMVEGFESGRYDG